MSGTSAAAAVTAGAAAVLAGARPRASAVDLFSLLVGSAQATAAPSVSWVGRVDVQAAVQQEVVVEPATVTFGPVSRGSLAIERTVVVRNVSTRRLFIPFQGSSDEGVEVASVSSGLRLRPGASGEVVVRAEVGSLPADSRVATGQLLLHVGGSGAVRLPWVMAFPTADADLLSQVSLRATGESVSDATPAVVSFVVGAIEPDKQLQVRPVDVLEIQLWRGSTFLGVLSRRREVLPGRYAFGLTGRGQRGEQLPRGSYVIRLVARPDDGTRRQIESVDYVVS